LRIANCEWRIAEWTDPKIRNPQSGIRNRVAAPARWGIIFLTKKQVKILEGIFAHPVRANSDWHDVESLLSALGAELSEGRGSRVRVALNGVRATFHEPHPRKKLGRVRFAPCGISSSAPEYDPPTEKPFVEFNEI